MRLKEPWCQDLEAGGGAARERFEEWLAGGVDPSPVPDLDLPRTMTMCRVAALLGALEVRAWRDVERTKVGWENRAGKWHHSEVRILWRLEPADVARVRAAAIAAIEAAGGRVELGSMVATVAAGELRIVMA